jgi:pimeloyl-ACP methyl ester carboxylesterase
VTVCAGAAGCGEAEGANPLTTSSSTTGLGGGGGSTGIGAGGSAGAGGSGGSGGTITLPDPFQPPADNVDVWTGKLPPGGLLDHDVRVYFPNPAPPDAPLPLLVFAHGTGLGENAYEDTFRHVAKFGYVVASVEYSYNALSPNHHAPADSMLGAIELLGQNPPSELESIVDVTRLAVGGHGLGAKAALWMALEGADIDGVVAFDPIDDDEGLLPSVKRPSLTPELMTSMATPTLYLGSELGPAGIIKCVAHESNACRFHEATPSGITSWLMVLADFGHLQFVDGYNCVTCLTCNRGQEAEHNATQVVARGLTVAFLGAMLKSESGYLDYLEGSGLQQLRDNGRVLDEQEQFQFCAEQ